MKFIPHAYQGPAIDHVLDVPYSALWMSMGLGKTPSVLTAVAELIDRLDAIRTLVVAPLRVATMVWAQETQKWDHTKHLSVQLIRGTPEQRRAQIRTPAAIHVINYEQLKWLVQDLGGKWPWDLVVLDESSKLANEQSWRFKAIKHIRPRVKRLVELTGSPAAGGLHKVWAPVYLLDEGKRLFKTAGMFKRRWFHKPASREDTQWRPVDGALEEVTERLRDIVYCLRAEDHLDLPPLIKNTIEVDLGDKLMKDYRRLEREMFLELEAGAIDSPTAAATSGKCRQFANGAAYLDGGEGRNKPWAAIHDAKLEALDSVISEAEGEPVLVAYAYRCEIERIKAAFPEAEVFTNDPEVEARWNRGEIPLLLAHPQSAGHGVNLQLGGRTLCFFGLTWSLEDYEQIIERLGPTRQLQAGLNRTVFVHHIVARGTVDELMMERLETHATVQDVLRAAMRRLAGWLWTSGNA